MSVGIFSAQNVATFTNRAQSDVHEVSVLKKAKEAQELEGNGELQLLQAAAQVMEQSPAPSMPGSGTIINVKA